MTPHGGSGLAGTGWLNGLPVGVAAFDHDLSLLFANPRFFSLLGITPSTQDPIGCLNGLLAALKASATRQGREGADCLVAAQFEPGHANGSRRWRRADATVIDIASTALPGGGRVVILSEITSLVRAEQEAAGQAAALRSILEAIPHGISVYGADRRVAMFNHTYTRVMADSPLTIGDHLEEVIRRRAEAGEYGPGPLAEVFDQQMAFFISGLTARRRRRPNGSVIDIRTAPLPDGGYVSVVTDVTALTAAETELTRRAGEMAAMLAGIRHGILLWGPDHRLIASNAMASELLEHPPGLLTPGLSEKDYLDTIGRHGTLRLDPVARGRIPTLDRSKPFVRQEVTHSGRTLEIRSDPVANGGWVTTFSDVTEARRAEQEARQAKEAAEAASQAKSRFLATMSHELRTPLNAVIGFSDAMLREADHPSPARVAEFARQINDSGRHLLDLINIILDVASVESGRVEMTLEPVQVARLVRNAVRSAEAAAQAAQLTVATDVPAALPGVRGDERRLMQVMNHLLSNAIKFTEAGGVITVGARPDTDGAVLIFVRDTGIGIDPEHLERVFEPFTQIDDALSRQFQGTGLGLYLSRALIAGHRGTLVLKSQPGEGTTAEIRMPADRGAGREAK